MAYIGSSPTKVVSRQSANIFTYTATANQTAFTGSDANGNTLACTPSDIMVHMNGLRLEKSDYVATTTTVTLGSGAAAGDEVTITAFVTFETADAYTKSASDARYVNTAGDTMTGALTVSGSNGELLNVSSTTGSELAVYVDGNEISFRADADNNNNDSVMTFDLDGSEKMRIDGSGRVTMPYQPSFRATSSSGISTGSGVSTLVLPTVKHNVGNHYNSSNYTFTCPVAGVYYFGFHGNIRDVGSNAATSLYGQIMKNGARAGIYYCSDNPDGSWHLISGQMVISCAANDAILVSSGANAYWDSSDWTQFYGHLLG